MTNEEFNYYFRTNTGFNNWTIEWVLSHFNENSTFEDRVYWFNRLVGKIQLLYTVYSDVEKNTVLRYGRFDKYDYPFDEQYISGGFCFTGKSSALTRKLIDIIFGEYSQHDIEYLLNDDGTPILLDNGDPIII